MNYIFNTIRVRFLNFLSTDHSISKEWPVAVGTRRIERIHEKKWNNRTLHASILVVKVLPFSWIEQRFLFSFFFFWTQRTNKNLNIDGAERKSCSKLRKKNFQMKMEWKNLYSTKKGRDFFFVSAAVRQKLHDSIIDFHFVWALVSLTALMENTQKVSI